MNNPLVIRRAHLQDWINHCSTEEQILVFFNAIDQEATNSASMRMGNTRIDPSAFGNTVIDFSNQDLRSNEYILLTKWGKATLLPQAVSRFRELTAADVSTLALGIISWYIRPLVSANGQRCPYIPRWYADQFLEKLDALTPLDQLAHFERMITNLREHLNGQWVAPILQFGVQHINQRGVVRIASFIHLFLRARVDAQSIENLARQKQKREDLAKQRQQMPSIIKDIESLWIIDSVNDP